MLQQTTRCPPIPVKLQTNGNRSWSRVVPLAISPAVYLMDVVVGPEGSSIRRNGGFELIEPRCLIVLNRPLSRGCRLKFRQGASLGPLAAVLLRSHPLLLSGWARASFGAQEGGGAIQQLVGELLAWRWYRGLS